MSAPLILLHGDDGFGLDLALREFGAEIDATDRVEILPDRSPDEAALDRARLEAGTMSMFGAHLTVLRQPLRAAGRSTSAADRLVALVGDLPDGSALALLEERPSRDLAKPPALLKRLAEAVKRARRTGRRSAMPRGAASCAAGSRRTRHASACRSRCVRPTSWPSASAARSGRPTWSAAR